MQRSCWQWSKLKLTDQQLSAPSASAGYTVVCAILRSSIEDIDFHRDQVVILSWERSFCSQFRDDAERRLCSLDMQRLTVLQSVYPYLWWEYDRHQLVRLRPGLGGIGFAVGELRFSWASAAPTWLVISLILLVIDRTAMNMALLYLWG